VPSSLRRLPLRSTVYEDEEEVALVTIAAAATSSTPCPPVTCMRRRSYYILGSWNKLPQVNHHDILEA